MNKLIKILAFVFLGMIANIGEMSATHIVGGDITYRHVEEDVYEVDFTFRRDCFTGADDAQFDNQAIIYIFDEDGNLMLPLGNGGRIIMNLNPDDTLNTFIESDCGFEGAQVCVHETIYRERVRLPYRPGKGGYNLVYQRCCRNNTLANIIEPDNTGGTWMTFLSEETLRTNNNSPTFKEWPYVYICANEDVDFDHSAYDPDGDSLVYKLYTPYAGLSDAQPVPFQPPYPPYELIEWQGAYGQENMLGGDDPLRIDSQTGRLTGTPPMVGQFLVGIIVEEYRDGELIGFTRRDFQYNVRVCSPPPTANFVANDNECKGETVEFENTSISATDFQWNFNYPSEDPQFISNEENPTFTYDAPGVYQVQLIAVRGTDSCRSEIIKTVPAIDADINVDFDLLIESCQGNGYTVKVEDTSTDNETGQSIVNRRWIVTQDGEVQEFQGSDVIFTVMNGTFEVDLQVESTSGCLSSISNVYNTDSFEHETDIAYEISECADGENVTLLLTDLSPDLNPYDMAQVISWTISTSDGIVTESGSQIDIEVGKNDVINVLLEVDFGGNCTAEKSITIDVADFRPRASYSYQAEECPDEETVTLVFNNTSDETNELYTSESVRWEIINQSTQESFISSDNSFNYTIEKDVEIRLQQIVVFENGCVDTLLEIFVPGPYPTLVFTTNPRKICLGDTVGFLENANPNWTYTWNPLDGIYFEDPEDTSTGKIIGIEDTSYEITVTDGICTVVDVLPVEVLTGDNLTVEGEQVICDRNFDLSVSGGIPPGNFEWSLDPTFATIVNTGSTYSGELNAVSQTFYVRFTGETCGDDFVAYTVEEKQFNLDFGTDPVEVCEGDTIQLLQNYNPDYTYTYEPTDGIIFPNGMNAAPYIIGTVDRMYTVNVTDGRCEDTQTFIVDVQDVIDVEIEGSNYVCEGENVVLSVPELSEDLYEWSDTPDFSNIISTDRILEFDMEADSMFFYVRYTGATCARSSDAIKVKRYVFDLLYVETMEVCAGDTLNYPVYNQGELNLTYLWRPDDHIISGGDSDNPQIAIGADETESFTLTFVALTPDDCEYNGEVVFNINERPVIDFSYELSECGEYTVCFDVEDGYNGFPNWNFGDPTTQDDKSIEQSPCYTYPGPGVYTVNLSNFTDVCGFAPIEKVVTINDDITIDDIDDVQRACLDETINFSVSSPNNNIDFVWISSQGDTLVKGANFSGIVNGEYEVTVHAIDPNGCKTTKAITVAPYQYDVVTNIPALLCEAQDFQVELSVNGSTEGYTYYWEPEEAIVSGGNTFNPIINSSVDRTFKVTITDEVNGCVVTESIAVESTSYDISIEAAPDAMINLGETITLQLEDTQSGYQYEWSTGETDSEIEVSPTEDTNYTVTVVDENGCIATDEITITVRQPQCDETDIFIPNAFSPNGDNTNDVFLVRSNFIDKIEMVVYNRWGQEMFRSNDQNIGWDGTFEGTRLSPDVYAYYVSIVCINQATYKKRGDVSLIE